MAKADSQPTNDRDMFAGEFDPPPYVNFLKTCPAATSEEERNEKAFAVATRLFTDYKVDQLKAESLMAKYWGPRCDPPPPKGYLSSSVTAAYRCAREAEALGPTSGGNDKNAIARAVSEAILANNLRGGNRPATVDEEIPEEASEGEVFLPLGSIDGNDIPETPWCVPGVLLDGKVAILSGQGGAGKSLMTLVLAVITTTGQPYAGFELADPFGPRKVMLLSAEDDRDELERRLIAVCDVMGVDRAALGNRLVIFKRQKNIRLVRRDTYGRDALTPYGQKVRDWIAKYNVGVVIADPFVKTHGGFDENSNDDMESVMTLLESIVTGLPCSMLIVSHNTKTGRANDQNAIRGASSIVNAARIGWGFGAVTAEEHRNAGAPGSYREYVRMELVKSNYGSRATPPGVFRFKSVMLPNGDERAGLEAWDFNSDAAGVNFATWEHGDAFIAMVRKGKDGRPFSTATRGPRAYRLDHATAEVFDMADADAQTIIEQAEEFGRIKRVAWEDSNRNNIEVWQVTDARDDFNNDA